MSRICLCCGKKIDEDSPLNWHSSCLKEFFGSTDFPSIELEEKSFTSLAEKQIEKGNTVTGVQKKLSFSFSKPNHRKTVPYSNEYILKTIDTEKPYLPEYEFVGMKLASICGFKTVPCILLGEKPGKMVYVVKRIDRVYENGRIRKIPMEDFAQLSLTQTEYKYNGSYERCAKTVIDRYSSSPTLDKIEFFRMVFFSYVIGNTDMHLKNFSLIKKGGGYTLSPFYDILPVLMIVKQTEMALSIHGKKTKLTKNDFLSFGETIGIKKDLAQALMLGVIAKEREMENFIEVSPLPQKQREDLARFLHERLAPFAAE